MPDAKHDDSAAERSALSRSQAEEVRVPGAPTAPQVGRRRQIILIAGAVAAVVLISVAVAVLTTSGRGGGSPALTQAQLDNLADSAGRVLEEQAPGFSRNLAMTAETTAATHGISHGGSSPLKWSKGQEFELAALCMGRGRVTVQWQAPGRVTGRLAVICSESGKIARTRFTPLADGQLIEFTLMPDHEAVGRSGIAVNIVEFH